MTDDQIIELYWQRNGDAISETKKKYGTYCCSIAMNILHNREDVEECVNDTWLHAWNAMPPQRPNRLKLFLARITRNLSLNRIQAQTAEKRGGSTITLVLDELAECIDNEADVEDTVSSRELETLICQFVRGLPQREGNIFVRRYFFTESVRQIAQRYAMTENNVSVVLNRTRKKLKKQLTVRGYFNHGSS